MHILYLSSLCSADKFEQIYLESEIKPQQQAQKFHHLLSKGLLHYSEQITFISRIPIDYGKKTSVRLHIEKETKGKAIFYYLPSIKFPAFRYIYYIMVVCIIATKWLFSNRNSKRLIVCDILNTTLSLSAQIVSRIFRVKIVAIVTDLPSSLIQEKEKTPISYSIATNFQKLLNLFIISKYDYYVLLTNQMNSVVNSKKRPFVIIEGVVDLEMIEKRNNLKDKYKDKIIIYAGAIYEKYGILRLLEAFSLINDNDARLWIFGSGNILDKILDFEASDNRIKYYGIVPNNKIVQEEIKASILINPRFTNAAYTKYSFPSKNIEYMVSGTPVLTTKLPGIPEDYMKYLYIIEDESVDGIKNSIERILSIDRIELHKKGMRARSFVLRNKNYLSQAKKIIDMIDV